MGWIIQKGGDHLCASTDYGWCQGFVHGYAAAGGESDELTIVLCKHQEVERYFNSVRCAVCGEYLGWWCPESRDHLCHYTGSSENCDYCGQPQERK